MRIEYDDDVLDEIAANVDLVEYIGQQLPLEKRGGDYYAHCPLHIDKTASLHISPDVNRYYCFSCERGGSIIGYLMDYEGLRYNDAVTKAAALAKVDLSKVRQSETMTYLKKLRRLSQNVSEPCVHEIIPYSEYEKYTRGRVDEWLEEGIQQEVLDMFDVRIDESANRIVYPVCDIDGNLINIKARTRYKNYKEMRLPKYINYRKVGVMDYFQSLNLTLPYVKEKGEVIIFESVKSVMKAYGWGYKNCVSAEKHSLTPEQITLLVKLGVDVALAYDSDISYWQTDVRRNINRLKPLTNVYLISDVRGLLGGAEAKNAPVDCGLEVWEELYENKRKVV